MQFKVKTYTLGIALILLFAGLYTLNIQAQATTTFIGHITDQNPVASFPLSASQGDTLTISMARVSGDLLPAFSLVDAAGKTILVASATSAATGPVITPTALVLSGAVGVTSSPNVTMTDTSAITPAATAAPGASAVPDFLQRSLTQIFSVPASGVYTLKATYHVPDQSTKATYGDFVITVNVASGSGTPDLARISGSAVPVMTLPAVVVSDLSDPNAKWTGSLSNAAYRINYLIYVTSGSSLNVTMLRADGDLAPVLALTNLTGDKVLARGKISGGMTATLVFSPPQAGWYLLVATRTDVDKGTTQGHFTLQMSLKPGK